MHDNKSFDIPAQLRQLAVIAQNSCEYQGDGWGCAWRDGDRWHLYKNIRPIWEDDLNQFGGTTLLLAHARSAFRNEGLDVVNNMPFIAGSEAFVFNGELHGVKLRGQGRNGAEKLFNFLRRFERQGHGTSLKQGLDIVKKRTRYIRAMNFVLAEPRALYINACFNEASDYFTLHKKQVGTRFTVCSEPFPNDSGWVSLPNDHLEVFSF